MRVQVELVSVVIPTRNRADLLTEQLDAFTRQTYCGAWELIVADNGSRDRTPDVVRSYADRLPVRHVDASDRRGASYARNRGASAAGGDFLLFVDDDDRVMPGWLTAMATAARCADIVRGRDRLTSRDAHGDATVRAETHGLERPFGFLPSISGANCGIRTSLFRHVGGFDERYQRLEDTELFWRAQLASSTPPAFVPDAVLEYRVRRGWRSVWEGAYSDSKAVPALFRSYHALGMPRSPGEHLSGVTRIARFGPRWLLSPHGREELAKETGWVIGRAVGSLQQHVLYL